MARITTIHGRTVDPTQFYRQALATARAYLAYVEGDVSDAARRQVAREAVGEAHSSLSQAAFFAALDALGGQEALLERLVHDLRA